MATCSTATLPAISTSFCSPKIKKGQLYKMFVTRASTDDVFVDITDVDEWADRLSNSTVIPGSGAAPVREFPVIGQMPEPEVTETNISLDRIYQSTPKNTFSGRIDEMSAENISFARTIQGLGGATYKAWFQADDFIIGGDAGINGTLKMSIVIPESRTEPQYIAWTFRYTGVQPEFDTTPLEVL